MKTGANKYEQKQIEKMMVQGQNSTMISRTLRIKEPVVAEFMKAFEKKGIKPMQQALEGLGTPNPKAFLNDFQQLRADIDELKDRIAKLEPKVAGKVLPKIK